ncbi:MAG: hypothetical protein J4215_03845 [Candidatus Diapherotrites archaeon]|uniref:Uncharacterized protein n=1 Tax=Candidatus Iainarchaeum sp. TaxID=3101447 RepID=A0A8T4L2Z0_9ARCH|nr:hypothetical protein [Candidatus Diapherotrites archaeon]
MTKANFQIEREPIWAGWCPIHSGVPPAFDAGGYVCTKCRKTVCAACIYTTNIGIICQNCVRTSKHAVTEATSLYPQQKISDKDRVGIARIEILLFLALTVVAAAISVLSVFNEPNHFFVIPILYGAIVTLVIAYAAMFIKNYLDKTRAKEISLTSDEKKELERLSNPKKK